MRIFTCFFLTCLLVLQSVSAQPEDVYLESNLNTLHQKLESYIMASTPDQKLRRLDDAHHWLHALSSFSNLGTLSIYERMSKLNESELAIYAELEQNINTFTNTDLVPIGDAKLAASQFVNKLDVLKNQFVVNAIKPVYYFRNDKSVMTLTFYGSFPVLLQDTTEVYLYNGQHKVGYTNATDTTLSFQFSPSQLGLDKLDPLAVSNIKLHLVGQLGRKVNPKKQLTSNFDFYAMALPASPGKLTITKSSTAKNIEKQTKRTRTFLLNGSKGDLVEKQCVPTHDGWTLVPESVELVVEISKGQKNRDWNYRKTNSGGKTCYTAEVFFNSSGTSGKLEYHLKYDVKRNTTEASTDVSEIPIAWGEQKQLEFDYPVTEIVYTDFMNTKTVVLDGSYQSFWLQLKQEGNRIAIKTPDISTLNNQP